MENKPELVEQFDTDTQNKLIVQRRKKVLLLTLLGALLFVFCIALSAFYIFSTKSPQQETIFNENQTQETELNVESSWQTYSDTNFGFQILYPPSLYEPYFDNPKAVLHMRPWKIKFIGENTSVNFTPDIVFEKKFSPLSVLFFRAKPEHVISPKGVWPSLQVSIFPLNEYSITSPEAPLSGTYSSIPNTSFSINSIYATTTLTLHHYSPTSSELLTEQLVNLFEPQVAYRSQKINQFDFLSFPDIKDYSHDLGKYSLLPEKHRVNISIVNNKYIVEVRFRNSENFSGDIDTVSIIKTLASLPEETSTIQDVNFRHSNIVHTADKTFIKHFDKTYGVSFTTPNYVNMTPTDRNSSAFNNEDNPFNVWVGETDMHTLLMHPHTAPLLRLVYEETKAEEPIYLGRYTLHNDQIAVFENKLIATSSDINTLVIDEVTYPIEKVSANFIPTTEDTVHCEYYEKIEGKGGDAADCSIYNMPDNQIARCYSIESEPDLPAKICFIFFFDGTITEVKKSIIESFSTEMKNRSYNIWGENKCNYPGVSCYENYKGTNYYDGSRG